MKHLGHTTEKLFPVYTTFILVNVTKLDVSQLMKKGWKLAII